MATTRCAADRRDRTAAFAAVHEYATRRPTHGPAMWRQVTQTMTPELRDELRQQLAAHRPASPQAMARAILSTYSYAMRRGPRYLRPARARHVAAPTAEARRIAVVAPLAERRRSPRRAPRRAAPPRRRSADGDDGEPAPADTLTIGAAA